MGPYRVVLPNCGKPRSGSERGDLIKAERNEPGKTTGVHLSRSRRSGLLFLRSFFYLAIFAASWVSPSNRSIANYLPATGSILSYPTFSNRTSIKVYVSSKSSSTYPNHRYNYFFFQTIRSSCREIVVLRINVSIISCRVKSFLVIACNVTIQTMQRVFSNTRDCNIPGDATFDDAWTYLVARKEIDTNLKRLAPLYRLSHFGTWYWFC